MSDEDSISKAELDKLRDRAKKLAWEKSQLELVNSLITKLGAVSGLENTAETIARLVLQTIGGSNAIVYYFVDRVIHYADVYGEKKTLEVLGDDLVTQAWETRALAEVHHDFDDTKMLTPAFTQAATWATPLLVGGEVVGVFKMEGMLLAASDVRQEIQPFFTFAALVLKNEILGHSRLKQAYDSLSSAHDALKIEIAERKRAQESLQLTQLSVDRASEFIYWIGPDAEFHYVNDAVCQRLGYERRELLNKTVFDVDPDFPRDKWKEHWSELKQQGSFTLQTQHQTKAGERFPVEVTVNFVEFRGREYNFAFARDITARKRAEEALLGAKEQLEVRVAERTVALREANEQLEIELAGRKQAESALQEQFSTLTGIIENANALIFAVDGQYRYTCFNEAHRAAMKALYGADVAVGVSLLDCQTVPEDREEAKRNIDRALAGERVVEVAESGEEQRSRLYYEVSHSPIRSASGAVIGVVVLAWDISERLRAEVALREKTAEVEHFFNVGLDLLCIADTDGYFRRLNLAWEKTLGSSREELMARPFLELIHPDDEPSTKGAVAALASQREVNNFVNRYRCKDGTYRWLEWRSVPEGNKIYAAARDITERKQAEEERVRLQQQLAQAQKMESIGSLAAGIAHDFNNLLSVILTCTDFAMEGARQGSDPRKDLLEVRKAGLRAAALTKQLLAFGRRQVLQPRLHDLNQILSGMESMVRRIIGEDIEVQLELAPDLGLAMVDANQVEQVIMNLVVNARDAMPRGGSLTIGTSNVELEEEYAALHLGIKPGPWVLLLVTDTGCGMDEPTRARVFEPFFTTKEKGRGTGLGLSTVFGIVTQSGGAVQVYSEPGQGTTFRVYFPRHAGAAATTSSGASVARPTGTETILVVEDEEIIRTLTKRILAAAGYTVLTAANGADALAICEQKGAQVKLLVTDVVMPRMSGAELADCIAAHWPEIKVLFTSGYAGDGIAQHGRVGEGAHFLGKPFSSADLTRRVRAILDEVSAPGGGSLAHRGLR